MDDVTVHQMLPRLSGWAKIKTLLACKRFKRGRNSAKALATLAVAAGPGSLKLLAHLVRELVYKGFI